MLLILKNVFLRNAKKQLIMIALTILGFIVSVSLLTLIQMVNVGRASYAQNNGKDLSHGDIAIHYTFDGVQDLDAQEKCRSQLFEYLNNLEGIDYTYESIYSNQGNLCYVNSDAYISESPLLRLIDINDISFFTQNVNGLSLDEVVIARNLTNRMPAQVGDNILISPGSYVFPLQLKIGGIIPDNEVFIKGAIDNSYIFLDRSVLFKHLQISDDVLKEMGYTQESYLFLLPTIYYVHGSEDMLMEIESFAAQLCQSNGIADGQYRIWKPEDAAGQFQSIYGTIDLILGIFTILSFLLSCCSIIYLVYMILLNDIRDINILKIYGLTTWKCIGLTFTEVLLILMPAVIIGILTGYYTMQFVVSGTSLYGIMNVGLREILISIRNILLIVMLSIAVIVFPIVYWGNKMKIMEILRQQNIGFMRKKQVYLMIVFLFLWILFVFSFVTDIKVSAIILSSIAAIILIVFILSYAIMALLTLIRLNGIAALAMNFIRKNVFKATLITVPVALVIVCLFIVITCNYTLLNQADEEIEKAKGYNVQIMTTMEGAVFLEDYKSQSGIDSYFSRYDEACTLLEVNHIEQVAETSVSYFSKIPNLQDMQQLSEGAVLDLGAANVMKVKVGDIIRIETFSGQEDVTVSGIVMSDMRSDFSIALYAPNQTLSNEIQNYYLLLDDNELESVKMFVDCNTNMILLSPGKMIFGMAVVFMNNKFLLNLLTAYFLLGSIVVVMYCTIIIYKGRNTDFCIYKAFGAANSTIQVIVFCECMLMSITICICGLILSGGITWLVSRYALPVALNIPLLIWIVSGANLIVGFASAMSIRVIKSKGYLNR